MRTTLLIGVAAGYLVALVPMLRCRADIAGFRRSLWVGIARRDASIHALALSYIAFGWPALVVTLSWSRGATRRALVELRDDLRAARHEPERTIARI